MSTFGAERGRDEVILVARLLLTLLFLVYGWGKLMDYGGAAAYMAQVGAPMPAIAALLAITVEIFVALAIAVGLFTRPLVLLLAAYTLVTGLIGHPFWMSDGASRYMDAINFYKNISIMGGCLLLYVTGPGRHSLDAKLRWHTARTAFN